MLNLITMSVNIFGNNIVIILKGDYDILINVAPLCFYIALYQ